MFKGAGAWDFEKFLEYYDFNIVRKGKNTLGTWINEGMIIILITFNKSKLNNMLNYFPVICQLVRVLFYFLIFRCA